MEIDQSHTTQSHTFNVIKIDLITNICISVIYVDSFCIFIVPYFDVARKSVCLTNSFAVVFVVFHYYPIRLVLVYHSVTGNEIPL